MVGCTIISRYNCLGLDFDDFGSPFSTSGTLGSLLEHVGGTFYIKKTDRGAKGAPRGASTKIKPPIWVPFGGHILIFFRVFDAKKSVLETHRVFS